MYEARGLVRPARTPGGTRLYSENDVERLRLIQRLTTELGLNLAGCGSWSASSATRSR
jgi:MerR family transcriptional regulator/heat shock protein HspR